MDQDHLLDQPHTEYLVVPILWHVQHNAEFVTQVFETLIPRIQTVHFEATQEQLHAISQEGVLIILHYDVFKYLSVGSTDECFENQHDGDDIFLFSPAEAEHSAPIGEVVKGISNARLVRSSAADLDGILGIRRTTVSKGGAEERYDMIATGKNKVSDKPLVPINDEVSTKFFWLFMSPNKIGR